MRWFPYGVGLLELGAVAVYLYHGEYRLALVWGCYAVSAFALGGVK